MNLDEVTDLPNITGDVGWICFYIGLGLIFMLGYIAEVI